MYFFKCLASVWDRKINFNIGMVLVATREQWKQ